MDAREVLVDSFTRIHELYGVVADDLDPDVLQSRPGGSGNSVGWLLWHLSRVQDSHVAELAGTDQAWEQWRDRFGLPLEPDDTGYGHSSDQVDSVKIDDPGALTGYHEDVHHLTMRYLDSVDAEGLDRIVDRHWDPPVTAGARLVSVVGDCLQHLGQAAYAKGL